MYRIRFPNGEEAVYKTVAELSTAVSSGVLGASAEVFHSSGNRWLPINLHPDFKAAASGKQPAVNSGKQPAVNPKSGKQPAVSFPAPLAVAAPGQDPAAAVAPIPGAPKKFSRSQPIPAAEIAKAAAAATQPAPAAAPAAPTPTAKTAAAPSPAKAAPPAEVETPLLMLDLIPEPAPVEAPIPVGVPAPIPMAKGPSAPAPATKPAPAPVVAEEPAWFPEPPEPAPAPKSPPDYESRAKKLRVMLALAMTFAVAVGLTGGVIMARPWLARTASGIGHSLQRIEGMDPAPLVSRTDSGMGPFPAPSAPYPVAMAAAARLDSILAYGTRTTTTQLRASRPRSMSYAEAYADAREEMDTGLDYIDFRRVFAGYRFANPDSIRAARRMVSAAGNILRVYRGREVMLEQTYRSDDPGGRGSLREAFETAEASRSLISDVDSLFGLLVAQQGRFTWTDTGLRFQEGRTAKSYQKLRSSILASLSAWRDSTAGPNRTTYPRLVAGLGQLGPPPAR